MSGKNTETTLFYKNDPTKDLLIKDLLILKGYKIAILTVQQLGRLMLDTKIGLPNIMFLSISHNLSFESEWRRASQQYKNIIAFQDIP